MISNNLYQAYQSVATRVEAKLVAATKLYLTDSPLSQIGPLNMLETAQALIDRGDGETALAVFKAAGVNDPRVQQLMAAAEGKLKQAESAKWARQDARRDGGRRSSAGGRDARLVREKLAAQPARVDAIRRALANYPHQEARSPYASLIARAMFPASIDFGLRRDADAAL